MLSLAVLEDGDRKRTELSVVRILKANPSLKDPNENQPGQHSLAQGWAFKSNISQDHPLTKSRKIFLIESYEEEEKTEMKANLENAAKAMTGTLQNEDNERVSSI